MAFGLEPKQLQKAEDAQIIEWMKFTCPKDQRNKEIQPQVVRPYIAR